MSIQKKKVSKIKQYFALYKENKIMFKNAKDYICQKPNDNVALSIQNLSRIFKTRINHYKKAVDKISFEVKKGSFHGFIGDNGAGKTTTIRSILGFYPSMYGCIYIDGIKSTNQKSKNKIGYIPEVAIFPKKLTVKEYLYSFAKMSNLSQKEAKIKINYLLKKYKFDTEEFDKSPERLSSGQKKKVLLMQALLNDPQILIMDEPAANLDPTARVEFYEAIKELNQEGKTIFISSHILLELEQYIDSYTVLSHGKVLDSGSIKEKLLDNLYNTKLKLNQNDLIIDFLEKNNYLYKINKKYIDIQLNKNSQKKLLQEIINRDLKIIDLKENKLSLNEIYFKAENAQ